MDLGIAYPYVKLKWEEHDIRRPRPSHGRGGETTFGADLLCCSARLAMAFDTNYVAATFPESGKLFKALQKLHHQQGSPWLFLSHISKLSFLTFRNCRMHRLGRPQKASNPPLRGRPVLLLLLTECCPRYLWPLPPAIQEGVGGTRALAHSIKPKKDTTYIVIIISCRENMSASIMDSTNTIGVIMNGYDRKRRKNSGVQGNVLQ